RIPAGARPAYRALEGALAAHEADFAAVLARIEAVADDLTRIAAAPPPRPRWDQGWFPRLDAAAAYAIVRHLRPRRIVEIGSGHSTRFFARAVADEGLATRIVAIDPAPRATLAGLNGVEWRRAPAQSVAEHECAHLQAGDILAIDSSHILVPGSDVDVLFGRVLPHLPPGTYVHIHDIFLPDDYPAAWEWRGYNEQLGVVAMLLGGRWAPVFASHYVITRMAATVADSTVARLPLMPGAIESSLWLRARSSVPPSAAARSRPPGHDEITAF
ncbi:MAG: class I SAM-dependent methyltransferase, partial [Alphaproteobacteria bacterium]